MIFYKIVAKLMETNEEFGIKHSDSRNEMISTMNEATRTMWSDSEKKNFIFCAGLRRDKAVCYVIIDNKKNVEDIFAKYIDIICLKVTNIKYKEITYGDIESNLCIANHYDFIEDEDEIIRSLGIDRLCHRHGMFTGYEEIILDDNVSREEIYTAAQSTFAQRTFTDELDRIYQKSQQITSYGHPVHA